MFCVWGVKSAVDFGRPLCRLRMPHTLVWRHPCLLAAIPNLPAVFPGRCASDPKRKTLAKGRAVCRAHWNAEVGSGLFSLLFRLRLLTILPQVFYNSGHPFSKVKSMFTGVLKGSFYTVRKSRMLWYGFDLDQTVINGRARLLPSRVK